jgi:hypothetical protein
MSSSDVALGALTLAGLRLLCTIGGCAGLVVVLFGLRLSRKASTSSQELHSPPADAPPIHELPPAEVPATAQQTIRLTTDPGPARSSEMSQQQKIAAALGRAGISNSSSWSSPVQSCQPTTQQEVPDGRSPLTRPVLSPDDSPIQRTSSSLIRKLFLLGGSILALISLIVFLTIR